MRIAVSMRVVESSTYPEARDAISHDWIRLLDRLGLTPILVPNSIHDPAAFLRDTDPAGLLLTNGEDVRAVGAGAPAPSEASARDRTEYALLDATLARKLPVLGVCRGLQVLNTYFGGTITANLSDACAGVEEHVSKSGHEVGIVEAGFQSLIGVEHMRVNSYHRHGVRTDDLAAPLRAFAVASGGVVEGLYHPAATALAIQWHPERASLAPDQDRRLLEHWLGLLRGASPWTR